MANCRSSRSNAPSGPRHRPQLMAAMATPAGLPLMAEVPGPAHSTNPPTAPAPLEPGALAPAPTLAAAPAPISALAQAPAALATTAATVPELATAAAPALPAATATPLAATSTAQDPSQLPAADPPQPIADGSEPEPGSLAALALLAELGIAPRAAAGAPLGPDDERFSPISIGHLTHRLVEVKLLLDQLTAEQKELHEILRLAHLRGDLRHLLPPGQTGGYQLPGGVLLHRRAGRKQWHYSPTVQELEAKLKARQVYEQLGGKAQSCLGAAFWELRFPKG